MDGGLDGALLRLSDLLGLEVLAAGTHAAGSVHGLLEGVALPAEDVVGVLAETGRVAGGEDERLGTVGGPLGLVVEGGGVPDHLVHELGNADGVGGGAGTAQAEEVGGTGGRVGDVVLVVGAVEVLAVPAAVIRAC